MKYHRRVYKANLPNSFNSVSPSLLPSAKNWHQKCKIFLKTFWKDVSINSFNMTCIVTVLIMCWGRPWYVYIKAISFESRSVCWNTVLIMALWTHASFMQTTVGQLKWTASRHAGTYKPYFKLNDALRGINVMCTQMPGIFH